MAATGREEIAHIHPRKFWLLVKPLPKHTAIKEMENILWKIIHLIATHDRSSGLRLRRQEGQRKVFYFLEEVFIALFVLLRLNENVINKILSFYVL